MNDQDDFEDFDSGLTADHGGDDLTPGGGSALKEAWNNNPLLKVGAVVLGLVVLYGGYSLAFSGEEEVVNKSKVMPGNVAEKAKIIPGQETNDVVYNQALVDKNNQEVEAAKETGGSAMPTPISTAKNDGIDLPEAQSQGSEDPLAEWRARREQTREKVDTLDTMPQMPEMPQMAQPDVTPMTQPPKPGQTSNTKADANAVKALAQQMRTILVAQTPGTSQTTVITAKEATYAKMQALAEAADKQALVASTNAPQSGAAGLSGASTLDGATPAEAKAKAKVIVPAGNLAYAQLMNELNSDLAGPALAQIMSGPFTGARAIGAFQVKDEYLVITFTRIIKDGAVYSINGIALNEQTTLSGHQSDVNSHYFTRIILPAAAEFVKGYAGAVAETGTETTVTSGGGAVQSDEAPSPKESLYAGLEEGADKAAEILDDQSDRPITVTVAKGTTMGILFMDSVTTESVQQ